SGVPHRGRSGAVARDAVRVNPRVNALPRATHRARPLLATLLVVLVARAAPAQRIPASHHGSATQRVGRTDIAASYNRPVARGRTLFGDLVQGGRILHPGADSATTIPISRHDTVD